MKFNFASNRAVAAGLFGFWATLGIGNAQPYVPPAGMNLNPNAYAPGAIQPPLPPKPPTRPAGAPPQGFNFNPSAYQPPALRGTSASPTAGTSSKSKSGTSTKASNYRAPAGKSASSSSLESRVGKLESSDRRQDLRLGRIERDVGLLPTGGGVMDIHQEGNRHTVKPGDTLFSIAARHGTSVGELRALNHLETDRVGIGTVLLLPEPGGSKASTVTSSAVVHVVSGQENMGSIARAYGVSEDSIAKANPTAYASDLQHGERLVIPNPKRLPQQSMSLPQHLPEADSDSFVEKASTTPSKTHTVRKGETLSKIASTHRVSVSSLMKANRIKNPNKIILGQRLTIPGKTIPQRTPTEPKTTLPGSQLAAADTLQPPLSAPKAPTPPAEPYELGAPVKPIASTSASAQASSDMMRGVVAYRMQRGDSLESVASLFSTTVENIRALNKHLPTGTPREGTEIYVPTVGAVSLN